MAQVKLQISGHDYRLACEDGQEQHLRVLVQKLDRQLQELKGSFGEVGDTRLTVMAAIALTDELEEARRSKGAMEAELQSLRARARPLDDKLVEAEDIIVEALTNAAERIERLTATLSAGPV
jgi:cell division protein ZapA